MANNETAESKNFKEQVQLLCKGFIAAGQIMACGQDANGNFFLNIRAKRAKAVGLPPKISHNKDKEILHTLRAAKENYFAATAA